LKEAIARSFSRAARTYDQHADVQRESSRILMAELADGSFRRVLEIGCGTGIHTASLLAAFPDARIRAVDIAPAMIEAAREKLGACGRVTFAVADGEAIADQLPGRFDLITANGTFQWFSHLSRALSSLGQILDPGGWIHFSLFGRHTLRELQDVLSVILPGEPAISAASFPDSAEVTQILHTVFGEAKVKDVSIERSHPDLLGLLRSLKLTGVVPGPARMRLQPNLLGHLDKVYRRRWGGIRATYRVLVCSARHREKMGS